MRLELLLSGVIPANFIPFDADLAVDERNYRRRIHYLVDFVQQLRVACKSRKDTMIKGSCYLLSIVHRERHERYWKHERARESFH